MAPIKFEEQLKDKLDKRTLYPSAGGWSKLSDRLDEDNNKSKKPMYWWLSIAAGLIIMLAVSIQFFNKDETQKIMPALVEEQVKDEQLKGKELKQQDLKGTGLAIEEEAIEVEKEIKSSVEQSQIIDYKKVTYNTSKAKKRLVEGSNLTTNNSKVINDISVMKPQEITSVSILKKVVATTLKEFKSENELVLDREVDSLLKVASKELFKNELKKKTIKTVDANALLLSVEEDMGQSFRSKVFEALKGGYKTVKTAVVDRKN
ncbi:hypothetical protein [Winogradskyella sp. UBA3174]|uniref:hypothetical protein n=1 Tax=Winogradskyella sp. UBA3174 TaxID=1947785 RepID=UPI0025CC3AA1|nr:hypothetical protein [Winogradskyella sp. UBA3174]|tara:strand:+ start:3495 stop:4277 length:783 start_codon:yes stop_codon:yes gene_type:complete